MTHAAPHDADSRTTRTILADDEATTTTSMVTDHVVAQMCGVRRRTVQRWRERGVGPAYHEYEGGAIRYHVHDVLTWRRARRVEPKRGQQ